MPTRRERDRSRAEKLAAQDPEWQALKATIETRKGSLKLPQTWSKRELHIRAHEAVARASHILTEARNVSGLDLDEWARFQMADNLATLRKLVVQVEERLGRPPESQVAVTARHRCTACGRAFTGVRSDARYCSGACRQRAYRQRGGDA